ncbi:MAG: amidohydrolase [Paenibacillaceae bacterium]|nr:amidohydrolase [Paenibacillaceae bacterium]
MNRIDENKWIEFRRDLHRNPELSFQESRTAAKVAQWLSELGLSVRTGVGGHGVVADLQGDRPGPTIALRADMDALPIQEETILPFASEVPGVMHACGHDVHTTVLLGAAELLAAQREILAGRIRFIFQSAEEILSGAKRMIDEGVLDDVDEIYGLHNLPTLSVGKVATTPGLFFGSIDRIEIRIDGRGGHGSMPELCADPIVAASAVVMGLQTAVSREIAPIEPAVMSIGSIHAGTANNVIPPTVKMTGTVRVFSEQVRSQMPQRIRRLTEHIATGYRCTAQVHYIEQVPATINEEACESAVRQSIRPIIGEDNIVNTVPSTGGEDFALYLKQVPGCYFWLGSGPQEHADQAYGLHSPRFVVEEACIPLGAKLLAAIGLTRLGGQHS